MRSRERFTLNIQFSWAVVLFLSLRSSWLRISRNKSGRGVEGVGVKERMWITCMHPLGMGNRYIFQKLSCRADVFQLRMFLYFPFISTVFTCVVYWKTWNSLVSIVRRPAVLTLVHTPSGIVSRTLRCSSQRSCSVSWMSHIWVTMKTGCIRYGYS
jgi:hypothetical protein